MRRESPRPVMSDSVPRFSRSYTICLSSTAGAWRPCLLIVTLPLREDRLADARRLLRRQLYISHMFDDDAAMRRCRRHAANFCCRRRFSASAAGAPLFQPGHTMPCQKKIYVPALLPCFSEEPRSLPRQEGLSNRDILFSPE